MACYTDYIVDEDVEDVDHDADYDVYHECVLRVHLRHGAPMVMATIASAPVLQLRSPLLLRLTKRLSCHSYAQWVCHSIVLMLTAVLTLGLLHGYVLRALAFLTVVPLTIGVLSSPWLCIKWLERAPSLELFSP